MNKAGVPAADRTLEEKKGFSNRRYRNIERCINFCKVSTIGYLPLLIDDEKRRSVIACDQGGRNTEALARLRELMRVDGGRWRQMSHSRSIGNTGIQGDARYLD